MQPLSGFPRRSEVIRRHKQGGGLVAAVLPIHYPRALLRAFDILPVEVWGPPQVDASYGTAHLQPYVCSIVRNAVSFLQTGGLDVIDLIVVPHACDSLQGLGSILIDFVRPRQPVLPLYIPRDRDEPAIAASFLADEFRTLYARLEAITRRSPSNAALLASIEREDVADRLLFELDACRESLPLAQTQYYRLVRSREYLPAEAFARLAREALAQSPAKPRSGTRVILSGIVPEPMSLFDALDEMGCVVAGDDLACCGRRRYSPSASTDPFVRMAESIVGGPPDSTRGSPIQVRLEHLKQLAVARHAKGVVFYDVKFCEPELFDLPSLRQGLQAAGLPSVAIEVDLNDPLAQQTLTRLEAFLEMIA